MKRAIAASVLARCGMFPLIQAFHPWSGIAALNYHRIGDGRASLFDRDLWSATAEDFDRHVKCLATHADLVTPPDLPDVLASGKGRFVLLTFDDGYLDNYEIAYPILKRHGVRATFFVTTGFLDHPVTAWWDDIAWMVRTSRQSGMGSGPWLPGPLVFDEPERQKAIDILLRTYKAMPADSTGAFLDFVAAATGSGRCDKGNANRCWMTWDMVREMRDAGMTIGGHTVDHPVLSRLPAERQCDEIERCARRFEAALGEPMRYFSYPVGERFAFSDATRECLRRSGVRYAFSYYGGTRSFKDWDDFDIRRIAVESYMTREWVRAAVTLPSVFGPAQ